MPRKREPCPTCGAPKAVYAKQCRSCASKETRLKHSVPIEDRFWNKVEKHADGCWLWTSNLCKGYGHFNVNGKTVKAHRFAYELVNGPIPDGMFLCHTCDNPRCVRPDHLWPGTPRDNSQDAVKKGRASITARKGVQSNPLRYKGENNPASILTPDKVAVIRTRYAAGGVTQKQLGIEYGVSQKTISAIVTRTIWR